MNARIQITAADDTIAETERQLEHWGKSCRDNSQVLGLPTISNVAQTVAHVRVQERLRKVQRKKALRAARRAWKEGDPPIDAKLVAEELGFAEQELTARGKSTEASILPPLQLDSISARIDVVVSSLAGWAKKCIFRSYLYNQPDRFAARELRMSTGEYTQRREAAVQIVAERLLQRYSATTLRGV
jgi:hypothetical protein